MYGRFTRQRFFAVFAFSMLVSVVATAAAFSQVHISPEFGLPHRPYVKLLGFLNPKIAPDETRPVLTIGLPGDEKRYAFLLTDLKILAGPLKTPQAILSEVKPFSTNFYLRTSPDMAAQIRNAAPTEQLAIMAEYSQADRALLVSKIEKEKQD